MIYFANSYIIITSSVKGLLGNEEDKKEKEIKTTILAVPSPDGCRGNDTFPFDALLIRLHLELQLLTMQLPDALNQNEHFISARLQKFCTRSSN